MGRNCEVCKEIQFKYKCPSCLAPYCSVACFKKHKESHCQKLQPPVEEAVKNDSTQPTAHPEKENNESTHRTQPLENESMMTKVEIKGQLRKTIDVEEENWIVSTEKLHSLVESQEIRDALKSNKLQELIFRIDSSEEPEQELDKALGDQSFHEFTEKILDIISPRTS